MITIISMDAASRELGRALPWFTGDCSRLRPAPVGFAEGRALRTP
ncbi:hypothetical protein [Georgenia sp. Marseille-Q6866]